MSLPTTLNVRAVGFTAAVIGVATTLVWKFGDLLELLFTPALAAAIVRVAAQVVLVILISIGAILVGWVITAFFRDLVLTPERDKDGKPKWDSHANRLKFCSFMWTFFVSFAALSLRYVHGAEWRWILEQLLYIGVGAILIGGASVPAYDVVVKRWWPRALRHYFPTKIVVTPTGEQERDADAPSGADEYTRLPSWARDDTIPKEPPK